MCVIDDGILIEVFSDTINKFRDVKFFNIFFVMVSWHVVIGDVNLEI
jgi:hypothetical protein